MNKQERALTTSRSRITWDAPERNLHDSVKACMPDSGQNMNGLEWVDLCMIILGDFPEDASKLFEIS